MKSYRSQKIYQAVPNQLFYIEMSKVIDNLLTRAEVLMITPSDNTDQFIGFICYETIGNNVILHYIYVKHLFRKMGIASDIVKDVIPYLSSKPVLYSHVSRIPEATLDKYKLIFNPFILVS